jgi:putative phage-type endonuclease
VDSNQLTPCESVDEWLEERRQLIGASESPAILGVGYGDENAHTVWGRKTGTLVDDKPDSEVLDWGHEIQPAILRMFSKRTGLIVEDLGQFTLQRCEQYPFIGATLDGLTRTDDGPAVVEAKNVGVYNRRDWEQDEPPLRVMVQIQHQMLAAGCHIGFAVACIGGNRLVWRRVERNERFIDKVLIPQLTRFWGYVQRRELPPLDDSHATSRLLNALWPEDSGATVAMPDEAALWFDELTALKAAEKLISQRRTGIENHIKAAMGEAAIGALPDGREFTWKTQTRKECVMPETTFRVLRQRTPKWHTGQAITTAYSEVTARLLTSGATLRAESESGSRYFDLPSGVQVRVSDHDANDATMAWMLRNGVQEVRVDADNWRDQLAAVSGEERFLTGAN